MTKKRTAHIVSHSHWDREWYLPYEKHHVRLVQLVDSLLDRLDEESEFRSFFMDGQTIILEDYLQVRPDQKERLLRHIQNGRILIGPWYILQDAFLTSSEANVRNMQIGHQDALKYGEVSKIGYFPDTFGLCGQTPQLMQQSGIQNAFFGRGVKPTGFNNEVSDGDYESSYSELIWEGPDGSKVLGILFANWYSNGNEVPVDPVEAKAYWDRKLADAEKYASTSELLYMNGCDHQPAQLDLPEAIRTASELYPDTEFIHSNFNDYLNALHRSLDCELSTVQGELRSQRTDGWGTLVNTASSRIYLKQMNQQGQTLLEKVAEPLSAYAHQLGHAYPHHLFTYAWKTLMQNHPHDSICGCSVDEVHREMVTRFDKSRHVTESIVQNSMESIANHVDTSCFAEYGDHACPFIVFNTTGLDRSGVVTVELDIARIYFREGETIEKMRNQMTSLEIHPHRVIDHGGRQLEYQLTDLGLHFGYDLPDDKFRQPYFSRRVRLELHVEAVPANGHQVYAWMKDVVERPHSEIKESSLLHERTLENEFIAARIEDNGSITLTDKANGKVYRGLGIYENSGDIGNEYMYCQPKNTNVLTTEALIADISIVSDQPYACTVQIVHDWDIPVSADELLAAEQQGIVWFPSRQAGRSTETVKLHITTTVTLEKYSKGLQVKSSFDNQAKDHRIRMLFPTDLISDVHQADSMFEIATRSTEPSSEWTNPDNSQHQQAFVSVKDDVTGLTIANKGLNEYEVLRDGRNTIAVTLLRCTGELGDWGVFYTPEAQCLGPAQAELMIIPHGSAVAEEAYALAYQYQIPWMTVSTDIHKGSLQPKHQWLQASGNDMQLSSVKVAEATGDLAIRWFNMTTSPTTLAFEPRMTYSQAYKSNILESHEEALTADSNAVIQLEVKAAEIVTVVLNKSI